MADNYLERKMEEHRQASTQRKSSVGPTKGKLSFNFPPRRVLLLQLGDQLTSRLAKAYGEIGCRVAIYPESSANVSGARLINSTGNPATDFAAVLKAWGDIDIVVSSTNSHLLDDSLQSIISNRQSLPYPNDYGLRLILTKDSTSSQIENYAQFNPCFIETTQPYDPDMTQKIISSVLFLSINEMSSTNIHL